MHGTRLPPQSFCGRTGRVTHKQPWRWATNVNDYTGTKAVEQLAELTEVMKIIAVELRRIRNVTEADKGCGSLMGDYLHDAKMGDDLDTALREAMNWTMS